MHRDQLQAQRSVTSMGSLYLFLLFSSDVHKSRGADTEGHRCSFINLQELPTGISSVSSLTAVFMFSLYFSRVGE